jgi:hypothetical protein
VTVNTRATGEASSQAGGTHCLKPFFIANTSLAPSTATIDSACAGYNQAMFNPNVTDPATGVPLLTNYAQTMRGTDITLRPVGQSQVPKNDAVPSQYYSLDFGNGASTYSCAISHCLNDPSCGVDTTVLQNFTGSCGSLLNTENGKMTQKTLTGVSNLIGNPPDIWASGFSILRAGRLRADARYQPVADYRARLGQLQQGPGSRQAAGSLHRLCRIFY